MAASSYVALSPPTPKAPGMTLAFVEESGVQAPAAGGPSSGIGAWFANFLRRIGLGFIADWIWGKPWPDATPTAERSANTTMRTNVAALLNQSVYNISDNDWKNMSLTTKKARLNALLASAQAIMGTSANTSILWRTGVDYGGAISGRRVVINEDRFATESRQTMMRYVFHELRHIYQIEAYEDGKHVASVTTRQKWKDNYGNYNNAGYPNGPHMRQPIEFDAYYFASQYTKTSFNNNFGEPDYWANWFTSW